MDTVLEHRLDVRASWGLLGPIEPVVVDALSVGALVGEAGELVVGLSDLGITRYSSNLKGMLFSILRWFSGRSLRCIYDLLW